MTPSSWYEVTPEPIALTIASHLLDDAPRPQVVIDAFCGVGGNAIAFALHDKCEHVIAVDLDPAAIAAARWNAAVYGVFYKITFIVGDVLDLTPAYEFLPAHIKRHKKTQGVADIAFASPPWGGTSYRTKQIYDLETDLQPVGITALVDALVRWTDPGDGILRRMGLFLPRSSDLRQVARTVERLDLIEGRGRKRNAQVVHYCLQSQSKAVGVYFGMEAEDEEDEGGGEEVDMELDEDSGTAQGQGLDEPAEVEKSAEEVWKRIAGASGS